MADSVVSGYLRMAYWSSGLTLGTDLREYFGLRSRRSVFGRWNLVVYRLATVFFPVAPASALAALAAVSASLPCAPRATRASGAAVSRGEGAGRLAGLAARGARGALRGSHHVDVVCYERVAQGWCWSRGRPEHSKPHGHQCPC